jgi:competence protein ComEC
MIRIAALFAAGILSAIFFDEWIRDRLIIWLLLTVCATYLIIWLLPRSQLRKFASGAVGTVFLFLAGYGNARLSHETLHADHLSSNNEKILSYTVELISPVEEKDRSWKRTGRLKSIQTSTGWKPASGRLNLHWPKDQQVGGLDYGDILLIKGSPQEVKGPQNPHEFDFKKFLAYKNIYHQHYVRGGQWALFAKASHHGFLYYANRARNWSVATIKSAVTSEREQALVIALVIGVTDGLDNELLNAYSASGTMHVLAVSGLHVSIIYGLLLLLFRPLGKSAASLWTTAIVSLIVLWGYAFITGLSPSVLRAVAMFSFVAIAKPIGRNTNIYNTLAASAFCLLVYDPFLIMSVGFQLSYLAVIGIVYLQRPICNLWAPRSALVSWMWQLTGVSIAAQVATLPISLLYFHQFPVYFLVANLVVIPASFVVLIGGIVLLLVSPIAFLAGWIGIGLEWFVWLMNESVFLVERMPWCLIDGIYISSVQSVALFFMIVSSIISIRFRSFNAFVVLLTSVLVFTSSSWHREIAGFKRTVLTVYSVQGHSALEWSREGQSLLFMDSALANDPGKQKFHLRPNQVAQMIQTSKALQMNTKANNLGLFQIGNKSFLVIPKKDFIVPSNLRVDYLIISNESVKSIAGLATHITFSYLIVDGSNSVRYARRVEAETRSMEKQCYSVREDGALAIELAP